MEEMTERKVRETEIYHGKILNLYKDDILLPDGKPGIREYIRHIGASCVVPMSDNENIYMVRQFRYPFRKVLLEIPAGKLDSKGEDPLEAAKRELREETGAEASEWISLGAYYPTCAYSDEVIHMYLARDLRFGSTDPDEDEFIETESIPLTDLIEMIMSDQIRDGKTQTALLKAYQFLKKEGQKN